MNKHLNFYNQDIFFEDNFNPKQDSFDFFNIDQIYSNPITPNLLSHSQLSQHEQDNGQKAFQEKVSVVEQKPKHRPESSFTKNVCYNICQKTIKVIRKGIYSEKVNQLCSEFEYSAENFQIQIIKRKQQFTGPKALKSFVDSKTPVSLIFGKFMKWFLEQKYLRYAINNGEMDNIKVYISYKNEVMLSLLP